MKKQKTNGISIFVMIMIVVLVIGITQTSMVVMAEEVAFIQDNQTSYEDDNETSIIDPIIDDTDVIPIVNPINGDIEKSIDNSNNNTTKKGNIHSDFGIIYYSTDAKNDEDFAEPIYTNKANMEKAVKGSSNNFVMAKHNTKNDETIIVTDSTEINHANLLLDENKESDPVNVENIIAWFTVMLITAGVIVLYIKSIVVASHNKEK